MKTKWWRYSSRPATPCAWPGVICAQYLIGPTLFPLYTFVLKAVSFGYLGPWILVWIGMMVFMPAYRASHSGMALLETWTHFWTLAFMLVGAITIVFAVLEILRRALPG